MSGLPLPLTSEPLILFSVHINPRDRQISVFFPYYIVLTFFNIPTLKHMLCLFAQEMNWRVQSTIPFRVTESQIYQQCLFFPQHWWSADNASVPPLFFCRRVVLSHQQRYASNCSVTHGETADVAWSFFSSKPIGEPLLPSFCRKTQPGACQWHGELKSGSTASNPKIWRLDLRTGNSTFDHYLLTWQEATTNSELSWSPNMPRGKRQCGMTAFIVILLPLLNSGFCDTSAHIQTYGHNLRGDIKF